MRKASADPCRQSITRYLHIDPFNASEVGQRTQLRGKPRGHEPQPGRSSAVQADDDQLAVSQRPYLTDGLQRLRQYGAQFGGPRPLLGRRPEQTLQRGKPAVALFEQLVYLCKAHESAESVCGAQP